jgi:hypothetical protein
MFWCLIKPGFMRKILLVFVQYILDLDHETDTAATGRYVTLPQAMQTVSNYVRC